MSRESSRSTSIEPAQVEAYLQTRGYPGAEVTDLHPLGQETQAGLKAYGYGRPLQATFTSGGTEHRMVIRTMSPDPFGHMRRSDRAAQMILCFDTFGSIPKHIHADDIGAFAADGRLLSVPPGEFFLVTNYVDGELYAHDLEALVKRSSAPPGDMARAEALGGYLAELHSARVDSLHHIRDLRDTIGSGEGIFGQTDGYPAHHPIATPERLTQIEVDAVRWRWKMRDKKRRARRTHGDFHPFNILFREGTDFSVLDCSRGGTGEPADDVACLSVNYIFFALHQRGEFRGAMRDLWNAFWESYLLNTQDEEVLEMVPLYFMWRLLVVASPVWYPDLSDDIRDRLLGFGERLLRDGGFSPDRIDELLR